MDCSKRPITEDQEPALIKIDKENTPFRDIQIDKNEFRIGRAKCNDKVIAHVLISRNHALLKCDENEDWTLTHLSSTTTTLLNDVPLELGVPKILFPGDVIQFSASGEFKYVFRLNHRRCRDAKRQRLDQCLIETVLSQQKTFAETQETKRKELEERLQTKQNEQVELRSRLDELLTNQELAEGKTQDLNKKIEDLRRQIKMGNGAELRLQKSYDDLLKTLGAERLKFEECLDEERKKWQRTLDTTIQEKETVEKNMREQMDKWREQQQAEWTAIMENLVKQEKSAQESLLNEKTELERKLRETENALKEQAAITEQLQSTIENVASTDISKMTAPELIYVQLLDDGKTGQIEIIDSMSVTMDDQSSSNAREEGVMMKVGSIMDQQMTCSICSELFVKAVTLNCMHSFCQHCIASWMKKKRECPVCRQSITAVNRSIVLDNFIEEMMENLSPELRDERKKILNANINC